MGQDSSVPLLLSGRVVHPDGSARHRYLLIRDGRVAWLGVSRPPAALLEGAREVVTSPRSWVFPGLINLHTHSAYNVLPLWYSRRAPFNNRFEWRADDGYRAAVSAPLKALRTTEAQQTLAVISELQAVAGGTTVLDKSTRLDANALVQPKIVLCRDIGNPQEIGLERKRRVDSVVDFFVPEGGVPLPKKDSQGRPLIDAYGRARDAGELGALLVHLAEGRTGFGSGRGVDPYSRAEFEAFMHHPALRAPEKVKAVPLSVVHGCGLNVTDPAHVRFLRERDISIIWSPVSNLLLYGDTLDAEALIQGGINVALGSDWSPSGSKHVWDEAKFARRFLAAIGSTISDADIFRMVTVSAARCLGTTALGRIEPGAFADLFILESPIDSDSALEVFFSTDDRDVLATIIDGVAIYGRRSFLRQFGLPLENLPRREGSAASDKAVHLPVPLAMPLGEAIDTIEDRLKELAPPVRRSNLLASSDKPYQRRMQRLRSRVEWLGWSARETRRRLAKGRPAADGRVPVPPAAVRVWCGFMAGDDWRRFLEQLGGVVFPSTVMLMRELGLTAYFPAVPPADRPPGCPDEVAIVFYESQRTYAETSRSVGGRLYSLLHEPVFRQAKNGSWSAFPAPLTEDPLESRKAYHLFDEAVDWHVGLTRVCIGMRQASQPDVASFHEALRRTCWNLKQDPGPVDAALMAIDDDYFVFWDHRARAGDGDDRHLTRLQQTNQMVMNADAVDTNAHGELFEAWNGIALRGGECLRLTFERRALFPW